MKVVVVMDSFKGSVTSMEAGEAAKKGIEKAYEKSKAPSVKVLSIADGGEGTIEAIFYETPEKIQKSQVQGPLFGEKVWAKYGQLDEKVVLEVAETSGILLVEKEQLNPWEATTYGLGEQIAQRIKAGARDFLIGLGGSATNDAGMGMLYALGVRFLDSNQQSLGYQLKDMASLAQIDVSQILPELASCTFKLASDVTNPLLGEQGATYIFGKQKGVKLSEMAEIDQLLQNFSELTKEVTHTDYVNYPGAGAAGGIAFSFLSYLNAALVSGFDEVAGLIHLEEEIAKSDLVITGEGLLDAQSLMGKVPIAVAKMAQVYQKPVIALAGGTSKDAYKCNEMGIQAFFPTIRRIASETETLQTATTLAAIQEATEQLFRFAQLF